MTSQFLYSQALQLKDKANKIVTKGVLFGNRYKQAEDLYEQAAIGFKQIQEYQLAGECYEKRAECFEKLNDLKKAASILGTAADCYSQVDFKNTMRVLSKAASLNAQNGKFLIAAQMEKNMGDMCNKQQDLLEAAKHYRKSADYYEAESSTANQVKCLELEAECWALLRDYEKATQIYEEIMDADTDGLLIKWMKNDFIFRILLCKFCTIKKEEFESEITYWRTQTMESLVEKGDNFQLTREFEFLEKIYKSFKKMDISILDIALETYMKVKKPNEYIEELLDAVGRKMEEIIQYSKNNVDLR